MSNPIRTASHRRTTSRRLGLFVAGLSAGVLVTAVARTAFDVGRTMRKAMDDELDGQALFRASTDVCDFVEDPNGNWPRGWDDLEGERRRRHPGGAVGDLAVERARVAVDWTADPIGVARMAGRPDEEAKVQVMWLHVDGDGPAGSRPAGVAAVRRV